MADDNKWLKDVLDNKLANARAAQQREDEARNRTRALEEGKDAFIAAMWSRLGEAVAEWNKLVPPDEALRVVVSPNGDEFKAEKLKYPAGTLIAKVYPNRLGVQVDQTFAQDDSPTRRGDSHQKWSFHLYGEEVALHSSGGGNVTIDNVAKWSAARSAWRSSRSSPPR